MWNVSKISESFQPCTRSSRLSTTLQWCTEVFQTKFYLLRFVHHFCISVYSVLQEQFQHFLWQSTLWRIPPPPYSYSHREQSLVVSGHCSLSEWPVLLPLRPPCGPLHTGTVILGMTCDSRPLKQTWVTSARKLRKNSISHWFLPSHTDTHNSSPRRLLQLPSWDSYSVSQCRKSVSESPVRVADVQCLLIDSQCALSGRITLPIVRHSSIFIYNHSVSHQYGLQIFNAFRTVYAFSRPSVAEIPCQL